MVAGEVIYHEGAFLRVDRKAIHDVIAESLSRPLSGAEEDRRRLAEAVFPHVKRFYDHWLPKEPGAPHTHYNSRF